jgi:hypothetical protein
MRNDLLDAAAATLLYFFKEVNWKLFLTALPFIFIVIFLEMPCGGK